MSPRAAERWSSLVRHWPLALILLFALVLRLALWGNLRRTGMISDEAEYLAAATWLVQGRGFSWYHGWLWTRAPLYPLFLAAHLKLFGPQLTPIYATQTLLSLVNTALSYALALQFVDRRSAIGDWKSPALAQPIANPQLLIATIAALLIAIYLPFAVYPQMLLGETFYLTLLLSAFVALGAWARTENRVGANTSVRPLQLLVAGLLLGLATLARGLTLGFVPLVALWIVWVADWRGVPPAAPAKIGDWRRRLWRKMVAFCLFICAFGLVLTPWSLYASRTFGGLVVVDTTGAYNLLLGARTAYDGTRNDAPARNFVLALINERLTLDQRRQLLGPQPAADGRVLDAACLYRQNDPRLLAALERPTTAITQAERQQLMTAEALCLIRAAPGAFALKSLVELIDFFKINYTGAERLTQGFALGWMPPWWTAALFVLDDTIYVLALPLAVLGFATMRRFETSDWRSEAKEQQSPIAVGSPRQAPLSNLIGLWWLYNLATAPLLFAINRFRLPLLPFAFICVAMYLTARHRRPMVDDPRQLPSYWHRSIARHSLFVVALLLALIALSPYAYLQAAPASWASYLGPYPSSLANTVLAWQTRPGYLREQQLMVALGQGDAATARALLAAGDVPTYTQAVATPLIEGLEGRAQAGLALLEQQQPPLAPLELWQTAVIRGDLLRRRGDMAGARAAFTPELVDAANPIEWTWAWLHPPPLPNNRIDLGGNLDLGYIRGFYLGEGDQSAEGQGTFRWSGPEARLRFPGAGSGVPQQLCLRADGRGWYDDLNMPRFRLALGDQPIADFELRRTVEIYCAPLPPSPPGADLLVTLRTPTFVPDAADLLAQQGPQVGQLRHLGLRLDWVEIRER